MGGVRINKPGLIDFLLSGFAGGATGVQKGLSARQQREATQKQQDILNQFRERELTQEEQDAEALKRFRMQQIGVQGLQLLFGKQSAKAQRELQKELGTTFDQKKILEQIRKGGAVDPVDVDIKRRAEEAAIQKVQAETIEIQDRVELDRAQNAFEESRQEAQDIFEINKLRGEFAFKVFEAETAAGIAKYNASVRQLTTQKTIHPFTKQAMREVSDWTWFAMTAKTDEDKQIALQRRDTADKDYEQAINKFEEGVEYKGQKLRFEKKRTGIPGLRRIPLIGGLFGGEEDIPSGGQGEFIVAPQQQQQLPPLDPGARGKQLGGVFESIFGVPFNQPETPAVTPRLLGDQDASLIQSLLQQRQTGTPQQDISDAIAAAKRGKKTSLTEGDKEGLRQLGFSDADIKKVEAGLGKK